MCDLQMGGKTGRAGAGRGVVAALTRMLFRWTEGSPDCVAGPGRVQRGVKGTRAVGRCGLAEGRLFSQGSLLATSGPPQQRVCQYV